MTVGKNPADRTLTARIAAPGKLVVTVTCTAAGHVATAQTVTLTAELAAGVTAIGARVLGGGVCKTDPAVPDGADAAYRCTMAKGGTLRVEAEAAATAAGLTVAWTAAGGVTIASQQQSTATVVVGPDSTTLHRRTASAALQCTANGAATATAKLAGSTRTALLTVACQPPVQIHGLADTTKTGTGKVTVGAAFTVTPADARCSTEPDTAAVATGTDPEDRTLSAKITAPGRLKVAVTCRAAGYAAASQTVTLSAEPPCSTHLGTLATGRVQRADNITADAACTTAHRGRSGTYYTARHTFTLDTPGWVTVGIGNDASNRNRLDTYLILLKGTGPAAAVIGRDDDSGPRTDSRLTDVFLQPGSYTIEATSYSPRRTGSYRLGIDATVTGLKPSYDAILDETVTIAFDYRPANAIVTVVSTSATALDRVISFGSGTGRLAVRPNLVRDHPITISIGARSPTGTEGVSGVAGQSARISTAVATGCPTGISAASAGGELCRIAAGTDAGSPYEVTPGTLIGVRKAARDSLAARSAPCQLSENQLIALLLAIGYGSCRERGPMGRGPRWRWAASTSRTGCPMIPTTPKASACGPSASSAALTKMSQNRGI